MKHVRPSRLLAALLLFGALAVVGVATARAASAASTATASDRLARTIVVPFFDGVDDAKELQPLKDWIARRVAAGQGRRAQSEIRDELKKIRRLREDNLQHPFDLAVGLRIERGALRDALYAHNVGPRDAAARYAKLAPVPPMEELFPTLVDDALPAQIGADVSAGGDTPAAAFADPPAPETAPAGGADAIEVDARELLDRLEADLTALDKMIDAAFRRDDLEEERLQRALKALPEFVKSATATPPSPALAARPSRP